jgi:phosphate transport system permease protein
VSVAPFSPADLRRDHLRRRRIVNRIMEFIAVTAAFCAVAILVVVIVSVVRRGAPALSWDFLTKTPVPFSFTPVPTGIANAIVGSAILVALAALMAVPFSVLVAIYLSEFAPRRVTPIVTLALDVLSGIPSIVIGIFVFGLLVVGHLQSGYAGAFALAVIMVPLVTRSAQEVLRLVPSSTREASLALGVSRWRTVVSIVLPQTIGGIVTGTTLAVARVAGETAPLLFTSSVVGQEINTDPHLPLASIPLTIFEYSESPNPEDHAQAWAAALVLIVFILLTTIAARVLAAHSKRRMGLSR